MILRIGFGILIGAAMGAVIGHYGRCSSNTCPLTVTPFRGSVYGGILGLFLALTSVALRHQDAPQDRTSVDAELSIVKPVSIAEPGADPTVMEDEPVLVHIMNAMQFEERVISTATPCLVDFYSDHCPPCRMLASTIDTLAERYRGNALICKVNLDGGRNGDLARRYGITGIPAVLFFSKGEEVGRCVGLREEADYAAFLDRFVPNSPTDAEKGSGNTAPKTRTP